MTYYHIEQNCDLAIIRLNDAICEFERKSGRKYTHILVPHASDELILISQDGKPLPTDLIPPEEALRLAMEEREEN